MSLADLERLQAEQREQHLRKINPSAFPRPHLAKTLNTVAEFEEGMPLVEQDFIAVDNSSQWATLLNIFPQHQRSDGAVSSDPSQFVLRCSVGLFRWKNDQRPSIGSMQPIAAGKILRAAKILGDSVLMDFDEFKKKFKPSGI
jgi:hypothetical protein